MPAAEIAAAITSFRMSLDIAKAMVSLRDEATFQAKAIELQTAIADALEKSITAREAYATQLNHIHTLEAEVANLKAWAAEKEDYELKPNFGGGVAYMLKPEARGSEPAHWLCPQCYANGKKGFLLPADHSGGIHRIYRCSECKIDRYMYGKPRWDDATQQSSQ
jgi:hypothetical protein